MRFKTIFAPGLIGDLLAIVAGALLTLSFAPFRIYPLAILSTALLLALWLPVSKARAFFRGWAFGLGLFGSGVYWVFISIHTYGHTSLFFAGGITAGFVAILALFPAFSGYFLNRFFPLRNTTKLLCAFPAIWVLIEWIRSWVFTGFPWLTIGYSQINSPLRGYASILSVYGVSLAVMLSAGLIINGILNAKKGHFKSFYLSVAGLILLWASGEYLSHVPWTNKKGSPVKVSLVQGSIPQEVKWSYDTIQPTLDSYAALSEPHWGSQMVIWPESAIPVAMHNALDFLNEMDEKAKKHHASFITGIPIKLSNDSYYNAVIALGEGQGSYLKQRLVPFGEYIPASKMLNRLLDILNVPMSNFVPGHRKHSQPLQASGLNISTFICYEIAFPEQVLSKDDTINLILTVSNDAWFGKSIAQAQHLEMAQMRALEMRRPVLFVSNDGITAVIKPNGVVQSIIPPHIPGVLTDTVQAMQGKTPWQRGGMDPLLILLFALILVAFKGRKK